MVNDLVARKSSGETRTSTARRGREADRWFLLCCLWLGGRRLVIRDRYAR
jgi:hypothetical protein